MGFPIIQSGSQEFTITKPAWGQSKKWLPIEVGCLARILPIGGPLWMNELVVVLEEVNLDGIRFAYRVAGRLGETMMPYYALDVQLYPVDKKK